jgi:hypothetical protein
MRANLRRVDRAAEAIAAAGLDTVPPAADPSAPPAEPAPAAMDLSEAMVAMRIAQRAFSAQLRVIETADQMMAESIRLGRRAG